MILIDGLQYCRWNREIFEEMRHSNVSAVHITVVYHGNARSALEKIGQLHQLVQQNDDLVMLTDSVDGIRAAQTQSKTAILLGFQTPAPIEETLSLVSVFAKLGVRIMQLSYNNQSTLASGCYETTDSGITRFGREVIREMNRVGMAIDMSHSGERSTLEAIELSNRPITISHANPQFWHDHCRNQSNNVLRALSESGGLLGFSLYPLHLKNGSNCALDDFCGMVARTADLMGIDRIGIGSDLCQNQPNSVLSWMRDGQWRFNEAVAEWPNQPNWFRSNLDWPKVVDGLRSIGFDQVEVEKIMGLNWLAFIEKVFV